MPIALTGLYELIVGQTMEGQVCLNVFWYRSVDGNDGLGIDLAVQFNTVVMPDWNPFVSEDVNFTDITVKNRGTVNADAVVPLNTNGAKIGSTLPQFTAATCTLIGETKDARSGFKRIGGLVESDQEDGLLIAPGSGEFTQLAEHFDDFLDAPGPDMFEPVIVNRKSLDTFPPDFIYTRIVEVNPKARLTSQSTRKIGRGI